MDTIAERDQDELSELSIDDDDESDTDEVNRDRKTKDYLSIYTLRGDEPDYNRACFINSSVPLEVQIKRVFENETGVDHMVSADTQESSRQGGDGSLESQNQRLSTSVHLSRMRFNPYLYEIHLSHGQFSWTVRRRYKHFRTLYEQIQLQRAKLRLHIPSKGAAEERIVYREEAREKGKRLLPPFPKLPEIAIRRGGVNQRRQMLESFLQAVVNVKTLRNNAELLKFLEISRLSFLPAIGGKQKEGIILKQSGGRKVSFGCCGWVSTLRGPWQKRWLFVKDTYVGYLRQDTWQIGDLLLMDRDFRVANDHDSSKRHCITIINMCRHLNIHCWTERKKHEWEEAIGKAAQSSGAQFINDNENDSFAPKRVSVPSRWYVDGASYFDAVANAMEAAREEIFICDWWLSPEIYLKRHEDDKERWRLDNVLLRKAKAGVRVFILLYKEIEMTLAINSYHSKVTLNNLHPNIKVMRHPNHVTGRVLIYAHHEKCVVIDQKAAFLGGIDLCFGRWDTPQHLVSDVVFDNETPATVSFPILETAISATEEQSVCLHSPPIEESNFTYPDPTSLASIHLEMNEAEDKDNAVSKPYFRSFSEEPKSTSVSSLATSTTYIVSSHPSPHKEQAVDCPEGEELSKSLPTSKLAARLRENKTLKALTALKQRRESNTIPIGLSAFSNQVMQQSSCQPLDDGQLAINIAKLKARRVSTSQPDRKSMKIKVAYNSNEESNHQPVKESLSRLRAHKTKLQWSVAKAAVRFKRYVSVDDEFLTPDNQLEMGANSVDVEVVSNTTKQLWVGKDYVNWIRKDCVDVNKPFEDLVDRKSVPRMPWHDIGCAVYGRCARDVARHFIQRWNAAKLEKYPFSMAHPHLIPKSYDRPGISRCIHNSSNDCTAQVLRSSGRWSAGISKVERSIYQAYLNAIETAQHYIYIENQFFISRGEEGDVVENRIMDAIIDRIVFMHRNRRQFRVFIILPLMPAFEGDIYNESGAAIRALMHYQLRTLTRSDSSLLKRLSTLLEGDDPLKYVSIMSLRTYGRFGDRLRSEILYVHSKLMIVDDRKVIIGSANINDRSMLGSRDSELATLFSDNKFTESQMNGERYEAGRFAYNLRVNLMCEHLGLDRHAEEDVVRDPVSDAFYKDVWFSTASKNSSLFYKVFKCYPDNAISTFSALRESIDDKDILCETNLEAAEEAVSRIKGHLVIYPLEFLSGEDLRPALMSKENLAPQYLWT